MSFCAAVVIPTHDRAVWLRECVESVLTQSLPASEVVVVDDGSTDETLEMLDSFGSRIVVVSQQRSGPAAARNRGVRRTSSEWIVFVDSDDRLQPHALETLARHHAERPGPDLLSFRATETDEAGVATGREFGKRSPGPLYSTANLLLHDAGGCSWFAVRASAFEACGGFDESLGSAEECDLVLRLSREHRLVAIPEPLVLRRQHGGMLSSDRELNARCWLRILERLRREHPDWVAGHRAVFRRSWSKEHLRLGKALLAGGGDRREARRALRVATSTRPLNLRGWAYRTRALLGLR